MEINNDLIPIFITGAPRSGTTMLASVLASRSDTIAINEMHYIHELLEIQQRNGKVEKEVQKKILATNSFIKKLELFNNSYELEKIIELDFKDTIRNLLLVSNQKYFNKDQIKYWIEHTPHNHKYYETLIKQYPNCRFVHIVRDGRAVFSSTKNIRWGLKDVVSGSISWKRQVGHCKELEKEDNFLTVKYEDFVLDTKTELKRICDFIPFDYRESMLDADGLSYTEEDKQSHSKSIGESPNKDSLNKWKTELTLSEVGHFNAFNHDLLNYYGYDIEYEKPYNPIKKYLIFGMGITKFIISRYKRKLFEK